MKATNMRLVTPNRVYMKVGCHSPRPCPIIIPNIPVPKNKAIRTFSFFAGRFLNFISRYAQYWTLLKIDGDFANMISPRDNTLNYPNLHFTSCQCSSAWLEHSPCKRKVEGSNSSIGFSF